MVCIDRWSVLAGGVLAGCLYQQIRMHTSTLVHKPSCTFSYKGSILYLDTVDEEEAAVCEVLVEEEDDECDPRESGPVCQPTDTAGTEGGLVGAG